MKLWWFCRKLCFYNFCVPSRTPNSFFLSLSFETKSFKEEFLLNKAMFSGNEIVFPFSRSKSSWIFLKTTSSLQKPTFEGFVKSFVSMIFASYWVGNCIRFLSHSLSNGVCHIYWYSLSVPVTSEKAPWVEIHVLVDRNRIRKYLHIRNPRRKSRGLSCVFLSRKILFFLPLPSPALLVAYLFFRSFLEAESSFEPRNDFWIALCLCFVVTWRCILR